MIPIPKAESSAVSSTESEAVSPPKHDFATDLFDMLSMDEKVPEASTDDLWAGFQSAAVQVPPITTDVSKPVDNINNQTKPNPVPTSELKICSKTHLLSHNHNHRSLRRMLKMIS